MSLLKEDETGNELFEKRIDPHGGFSEELGHVLCLGLVKGSSGGDGIVALAGVVARCLGWGLGLWEIGTTIETQRRWTDWEIKYLRQMNANEHGSDSCGLASGV